VWQRTYTREDDRFEKLPKRARVSLAVTQLLTASQPSVNRTPYPQMAPIKGVADTLQLDSAGGVARGSDIYHLHIGSPTPKRFILHG